MSSSASTAGAVEGRLTRSLSSAIRRYRALDPLRRTVRAVAACDDVISAVRLGLAELADPNAAAPMQAYMKSSMPFRGVKTPARVAMVRRILAERPLSDRWSWESTVRALWDEARFREERYVALNLSGHRSARPWQDASTVRLYDHFIVDGAWWDLVDTVATRLVRPILVAERAGVEPIVRRWAGDDDMWRRRAAILVQVGARGATDVELLADVVDANAADRQLFIRKAIGWALRDYARTDPAWVRSLVDARADRLSPLSIREATRHLDRP
jgi:3-methyladenine DNA glycosylase AlkD